MIFKLNEEINDPRLTARNNKLKANKITIDTLTYDILDVLEDHGYDANADDVIKFAEHEADILWNTRGTLNAEAWYENMFDEDPEQLKRLTKKINESLDPNEDDTLKNYAIELETGEIKVIKAKSMDDAANKVMNEYNIPLWAFGVCGIVDDDFAATCSKFESVDTSDLQTIATQKKQASELTDMLKEVEGDNNMVIKESYDDSLYVDIDELIGTLGRALEEGTRNPDVFAELADVYGRLVEMRDAGYQLNTVQNESLKESRLVEGPTDKDYMSYSEVISSLKEWADDDDELELTAEYVIFDNAGDPYRGGSLFRDADPSEVINYLHSNAKELQQATCYYIEGYGAYYIETETKTIGISDDPRALHLSQ